MEKCCVCGGREFDRIANYFKICKKCFTAKKLKEDEKFVPYTIGGK